MGNPDFRPIMQSGTEKQKPKLNPGGYHYEKTEPF